MIPSAVSRKHLIFRHAALMAVFSAPVFAQTSVKLDTSETLFAALTAINTCGYDAELTSSDRLRMAVRGEVGRNIESSEQAKSAVDSMCAFYRDHQQGNDARMLSAYVSLALYLGPPPTFVPRVKEADLPPDASGVLGFVPVLTKFYSEAGIRGIWEQHAAAYAGLGGQYREGLSNMIRDTEFYLRLPSANYMGR